MDRRAIERFSSKLYEASGAIRRSEISTSIAGYDAQDLLEEAHDSIDELLEEIDALLEEIDALKIRIEELEAEEGAA